MPIRLEALDAAEKFHVAVKGDATWLMAAHALKQRGGNPSWPLVVRKSDGTYAAVQYQTVLESGEVAPDTLAENLPGLAPVGTLKAGEMGTEAARDHVNGLKGLKLVVVVGDDGKFKGTIGKGAHRGEGLPSGKLNSMTSGPVDLSKLKDFLLDD